MGEWVFVDRTEADKDGRVGGREDGSSGGCLREEYSITGADKSSTFGPVRLFERFSEGGNSSATAMLTPTSLSPEQPSSSLFREAASDSWMLEESENRGIGATASRST